MGYFFPPPPAVSDPNPRPLSWYMSEVGPYPNLEDEAYFGVGLSDDKMADPSPGMPFDVGGIPHGNGIMTFRGFNMSPLKRLSNYQKLLALRSTGVWADPNSSSAQKYILPIDPESGGLAADYLDSIYQYVNYFDFSDENQPRRKLVIYVPHGEDVDMHVLELGEHGWQDEGFDFERDFRNNLPAIVQAIMMISGTFAAALGAPSAFSAAWAKIGELGVMAARGQSPSPDQVFTAWAKAGAALDVGGIITNSLSKSEIGKAIYGVVVRNPATDFLTKLEKTAKAYAASLPQINLQSALAGLVPPDILAADGPAAGLAGSMSADFQATVAAYKKRIDGDITGWLSIRKTVSDKELFDIVYASLVANNDPTAGIGAYQGNKVLSLQQTLQQMSITRISNQQAFSYKQVLGGAAATTGAPPASPGKKSSAAHSELLSYVGKLKRRYGI